MYHFLLSAVTHISILDRFRDITACSYVTACEQAVIQDVKYNFTADLTGTLDGSVYEICEPYFTYVV